MKNVLFLCVHNSARSQMAEAYMNKYGSDRFRSESAGLEPGVLNPLVVEVMREEGIDISGNKTKSVFDLHSAGRSFDYVVTVCDQKAADQCPVFPGMHKKISWNFEDPSNFTGTREEKLQATRIVRDKIREAVVELVKSLG